jgi:hypothetical protein
MMSHETEFAPDPGGTLKGEPAGQSVHAGGVRCWLPRLHGGVPRPPRERGGVLITLVVGLFSIATSWWRASVGAALLGWRSATGFVITSLRDPHITGPGDGWLLLVAVVAVRSAAAPSRCAD